MINFIINTIRVHIPFKYRDIKIYRLYKKSHWFYTKKMNFIADYYENKIYKKYGCIISKQAIIGKKLRMPHPIGIVIGAGVEIGDNCFIYQNVTLGRNNKDSWDYPKIGNNVVIYTNSVIIGDITIGNNVVIGCNSTILKSIDDNNTCVGVIK